MRDDFQQQRSSPSLFCPCEQFWHGQRCSLLGVVHPAFPLPTAASLPLKTDLEDGFGAVVVCDMSKACKFSSLDSCQKWFLWTHEEVGLAPHPVVGLVLQVGAVEKFSHALGFKSLDPFFSISKQGPCFTAIEEEGA